jgi:rhomboid protease GluP
VDFDHRARERVPDPRLAGRPWVTYGLLASIAVMYGVQLSVGSGENPFADIRLGANFPPLVFAGEWDRLITANFMHGVMVAHLHIVMNGIGLYFLGSGIEALLGRARLFIIYAVSCLGGSLASSFAQAGTYSLGASTGIVGLFAAIGWVLWRFRRELPPAMRRATRQWLFLLALNVALWVAFRDLNVDHAGHGGGFVAGGVATIALTIGWPPFDRTRSRSRIASAVAALLLGVFACGLAVSGIRYAQSVAGDRSAETSVMRAAMSRVDVSPDELNLWAWFVALDAGATRDLLELAREAATRAVDELPGDASPEERSAIVDTLATVHFRLGAHDEAVRLERHALSLEASPVYHSQLARFLQARVARDGPIVVPLGEAPDVRIAYEAESKSGRPEHVVTVRGEVGDGIEAYAIAVRGDELVGIVRYAVGPGHGGSGRHPVRERWPEGTELVVALVDGKPETAPEGARTIAVTRMDPEVAGYPGPL